MSAELLKALYGKLFEVVSTGPTVYNPVHVAVGGRIYALEAPPETTLPFITFTMDPPSVENFFSGTSGGSKARFTSVATISIFGKVDAGAVAIMDIEDKVATLLHDVNLTATGFDRLYVSTQQRGSIQYDGDELYLVDVSFDLTATQT